MSLLFQAVEEYLAEQHSNWGIYCNDIGEWCIIPRHSSGLKTDKFIIIDARTNEIRSCYVPRQGANYSETTLLQRITEVIECIE